MKYLLILVAAASLFSCQNTQEANSSPSSDNKIVIGKVDSIYSDILGESRNIWIHTPVNASEGVKYPVVYLLDGPAHFYSVTGLIKQLSTSNGNTLLPEMIVVAIPNTNRSRDLTPTEVYIDTFSGDSLQFESGGGDVFLDFIEKELIPFVDESYPTAPFRTFIGHSFGGLSVINALVSRPQLFSNYIAIDPSLWWDQQAYLHYADSILSNGNFDKKSLFVGVANTMEEGMDISSVKNDTTALTLHIRSILEFVNSMDNTDNGLSFGWKYYGEDGHGSVPLITEYDALRQQFKWYQFEDFNKLVEPESDLSVEEAVALLEAHYKNMSENMGYEVPPAEGEVNQLGYFFMNTDKMDKAIAFFDLNITNYPNSSNVYDSRGDCYLAQGDSTKALETFRKALEVGENDYTQGKIDMLEESLSKE